MPCHSDTAAYPLSSTQGINSFMQTTTKESICAYSSYSDELSKLEFPESYSGTQYMYIKSTTVYVPSPELGLSHRLSRQRVCPSPQNQRRGALACGLGVGVVPIPTTGERLSTLPTLCFSSKLNTISPTTSHTLE